MSETDLVKVVCNQNSDDFLNLKQSSKTYNLEEFEILRFGAFKNLEIYTFVCFEEPGFVFGSRTNDKTIRLYLEGFFKLEKKDVKQIFSTNKVDLKVRELSTETGEKYEAGFFEFISISNLNMLYVKKKDIEQLVTSSNEIEGEHGVESFSFGRRDVQLEIIQAVITALKYQPLAIPDGGKAKIKDACLTRKRFFTEAGFEHAWKTGVKSSLIKMANHEKYSSS